MIGIILAVVIIVILLLLIGFSWSAILSYAGFALLGLLALAMLLIALFFIGVLCSLFGFRKSKGTFSRFQHSEHFDRAVYQCHNEEYTCLFPAENFGRKGIYTDGEKKLLIRSTKRGRYAYDSHSLLIVAVGSAFSICSIIGFLSVFVLLF